MFLEKRLLLMETSKGLGQALHCGGTRGANVAMTSIPGIESHGLDEVP